MPTTSSALNYILENKNDIIFSPRKVSNAKGKIAIIMQGIFDNSYNKALKYNDEKAL